MSTATAEIIMGHYMCHNCGSKCLIPFKVTDPVKKLCVPDCKFYPCKNCGPTLLPDSLTAV